MKQLKLVTLVIAVSLAGVCSAQTMPRQVYCAGGGNFENADIHVSWTIGQEETIATVYQPGIIFNGGFQQYVDMAVGINETRMNDDITVFPNPCHDQVVIRVEAVQSLNYSYAMYDVNARLIMDGKLKQASSSLEETINMTSLPKGVYHLVVNIHNGQEHQNKTFKLIRY